MSECIATNAQSAKKPKQRPDSFVGKGVLSAENDVTWLRNDLSNLKTAREGNLSFIFFQLSFRVIRRPESF